MERQKRRKKKKDGSWIDEKGSSTEEGFLVYVVVGEMGG